MVRALRTLLRITQSLMPDDLRLFLIHSGNVGQRSLHLLKTLNVALGACQLECFDGNLPACSTAVLVADRPYPALERTLALSCWDAGVTLLTSILLGHKFRVGPVFKPGRTPCFDCWSRRVRSAEPSLELYDAIEERASDGPAGPWFFGELPLLVDQVAAHVAAEAVSLWTQTYSYSPHRMGHFWIGDCIFGSLEPHLFARVGTCIRCLPGERTRDAAQTLREYFQSKGTRKPVTERDR